MAVDQEEFKPALEELTSPSTSKRPPLELQLNKDYTSEELALIENLGLIPPSQLIGFKQDELKEYKEEKVDSLLEEKVQKTKGRKPQKPALIEEKEAAEKAKAVLKKYLESIDNANKLFLLTSPVKGKGLKQPKRNAYKIQDGEYGGLAIDVPRLFNEMKLNVFRGGKLIYSADADKSLINLITKRFNPKTKYSMNAVKIFNDLNLLSNLPKHRSSGKSRMVGSSVTYYNNANELADRLNVLIGSIIAGNNSPVIKNDLSQINDELLRINAIDGVLHEKFYKKYLS